MKEYRVLNLGAGVQSSALFLMIARGLVEPVDYAIFADTQDEPKAVYQHLRWLKNQRSGPEVLTGSAGNLGDHLIKGKNTTGGNFAAVPFFTKYPVKKAIAWDEDGVPTEWKFTEEHGMTRRQCSKEYKTDVINRVIREEVVGLKRRQRWPRGKVQIVQYFGISMDEAGRAFRIKERIRKEQNHYIPVFPFLEHVILGRKGWTRAEIKRWLEPLVPHLTPRSACVYCPFHDDKEWMAIRAVPEDWARAVEIDRALRTSGSVANRLEGAEMYAHRSCVPLEDVEFKNEKQFNMFTGECEGMCGV